jgi:hypothetical protein
MVSLRVCSRDAKRFTYLVNGRRPFYRNIARENLG